MHVAKVLGYTVR